MKIALVISKYHEGSGPNQECPEIAAEAVNRGCSVTIFTLSWEGTVPPGATVRKIPTRGFVSSTRLSNFFTDVNRLLGKKNFDLVIGFTKGPGLDVYLLFEDIYEPAADGSFLTGVFNHSKMIRTKLEQAVFAPESHTKIFYLTDPQKEHFIHQYGTQKERFYQVLPGSDFGKALASSLAERRRKMRNALNLSGKSIMLFFQASDMKLYGADRLLFALSALHPTVRSWVHCFFLGPKQPEIERLAEQLELTKTVSFPGVCSNGKDYLLAADLTVLPSRKNTAGSLIMESLSAGVPVICSENCGYQSYVRLSGGGCVIHSPFDQEEFNALLESVLFDPVHVTLLQNAAAVYAQKFRNNPSASKILTLLEKFHAQPKN